MFVRFDPIIAIVSMFLLAGQVRAAHTQVELLLPVRSAKPGETVPAGVRLRMDPEWHTYWRNSGASGIPTSIDWALPPGVSPGPIQWPVPHKMPPDDLVTYVYEHEVVLLIPLTLATDLKPGTYPIRGTASWLECKEQCLPGSQEFSAELVVGKESVPSDAAPIIQAWTERLPRLGDEALSARAAWDGPATDKTRVLTISWKATDGTGQPDFFPFASDQFEIQGATERVPNDSDRIRIRKTVKLFEGDWPQQISGLIVPNPGKDSIAYEVTLAIGGPSAGTAASSVSSDSPQPLWKMLFYAFLGGLILNIMPCVLPVIALKILGFVSESRSHPAHVRKLGLIYGLGVLTSFLALAGLVIGVKAAGHHAGWGMQFGNPMFLVGLTALITLVALSLFGIFEINLGAKVMGSAGTLAARQGSAGAFFNGVLATILATPCTAPFLGVALGFAFAQPPAIIVLVLLTVGFGLALPYVVLSLQPAWLKFLPRPGAWMERFKIAMGFPMLATAVWLFGLVPTHYGKRAWWLAMFLVILAFAAWVYGEFVQRGRQRRVWGVLISIGLLVFGYVVVLEKQLRWRDPIAETATAGAVQESPDGIPWKAWSPEAIAEAQAAGHPVFVEFTADWCITCQANEKFAIEVPSVREKLREIGAVTLRGDYTRFPPVITMELKRFGRAGVPLVLVYPGKADARPEVLPEALTPGLVLGALERAVGKFP